jgi:hypothetical protein
MKMFFAWLPAAVAAVGLSAFAQVSATIDINTAQTTPLNANFSGFNDELVFPAEFFDYRLNVIAAELAPGWVRYPSGSFSDAFDWQTGLMFQHGRRSFRGRISPRCSPKQFHGLTGKAAGRLWTGRTGPTFWA